MTRNETSIKTVAQEPYQVPVSIYDGKYTKTSQFLLPAIDLNIRKPVIFRYFENAFLDDRELIDHDIIRPIFVLWKVPNLQETEWQNIYKFLIGKDEYVTDYEVGMRGLYHLYMIVFSVPEKYKVLYTQFKQGQYSKFDSEYKKLFPQYVYDSKGETVESIIWGALYKSEILRSKIENEFGTTLDPKEDEYWERPRAKREYYRYQDKDT